MKKIFIAAAAALSMTVFCSCTTDQGAQTVVDYANSLATSDSKEVRSVKNAYLRNYSSTVTVGTAFDKFLSSPIWQYFEADTGEKVVQCNGTCSYQDKNVEAKVQFILKDDGTFEVGAFSLNDISQNAITTAAFLSKVFEGAGGTASSVQTSAPAAEIPAVTAAPVQQQSAATGSTLSSYSYVEDYLQDYKLDRDSITAGDLAQFEQHEVRQLLNALYARHGYTFESEENKRFFGRMKWYTSAGTSMDACESLLTSTERANKEVIVSYEKRMGWR